MMSCRLRPLLALAVFLSVAAVSTDALAVMSVDLGSEFMKIAIVKPGVPMEIALNDESKRKTPVVVSMRDGERMFGDPALGTAVRYPKLGYQYIQSLVGKTVDSPQVQQYKERFPYYNFETDEETQTLIFRQDEETTHTPEELLAMILEKAKEIAENFAEQPVTDAVITVPPFFNQAERRAIVRAAELGGIKLLQLMNDNTAVAFNYGIFRRKSFNSTAVHYMFYDVGAMSTVATVVSYQLVKAKNPATGIAETNPQLTVRGVGYNRELGGLHFQLRLRDHLVKLFNEKKLTKTDVRTNDRAMAKLFKEAGRLMKVLSANNQQHAQVEGLLEDLDFKALVTREEFETMCADLFEQVGKPVEDAMRLSEFTWDEIQEVILMGGGTRIPKVQEILRKVIGREELGKSINTDESAALGGVYQAAHLSKGFKVKPFIIKDATLFPIQVEFKSADGSTGLPENWFGWPHTKLQLAECEDVGDEDDDDDDFDEYDDYDDFDADDDLHRVCEDEHEEDNVEFERVKSADASSEASKTVKRTLFGLLNPYPQKKVMTFNKHTKDFSFSVNYGDLTHLSEDQQRELGSVSLQQYSLSGVDTAYNKHKDDAEPKGVKAHFRVDDSGVLTMERAEFTFETSGEPVEDGKDESTFSKIGSYFFGGSEDKDGKIEDSAPEETADSSKEEAGKKEEEGTQKEEETKSEGEKAPEQEIPAEEEPKKEEAAEEKQEGGEEKTEEKSEEAKESEKTEETKEGEKKEEEKKKKPATIKEPLTSENTLVDIKEPSADMVASAKSKIKEMKAKDVEKAKLEKAKNDLESFIVNTQDKLWQEVYEKCSTEEERETMRSTLSEAYDWLYEVEDDTERTVYEDKLKEIRKPFRDLFDRVKEFSERPAALEALNQVVNYSQTFLAGMKNLTGEDQPFTEVEYTTLEKLIITTKEWNDTSVAEQQAMSPTEKPIVLIEDIGKHIHDLDREVKYLLNKLKIYKPKTKPKANNTTKTNDTSSNDTVIEPEAGSEDSTIKLEDIQIDLGDSEVKEEGEKEEEEEGVKEEEEATETLELGDGTANTEDILPESEEAHKPNDEL